MELTENHFNEFKRIISKGMTKNEKQLRDQLLSIYKLDHDLVISLYKITTEFSYCIFYNNKIYLMLRKVDDKEYEKSMTLHEMAHAVQQEIVPMDKGRHNNRFFIIFHCLILISEKQGFYKPLHPKIFKTNTLGSKSYVNKLAAVLPAQFKDIIEENRNR